MTKKKILIVDDAATFRESITDFLIELPLNIDVYSAKNGREALKIVKKEVPDLIITDWEMPEMTGIEMIKKLKSNEQFKDIPVVMCTGIMTTSENLQTALKAGAIDYIRKPVEKIELLARTTSILKLADSYKKIHQLNENKDRILTLMSHDLKDPVSVVKGFLDLVLDNREDMDADKESFFLEHARNQIVVVYNMLENLFSYARREQGEIEFKPLKMEVGPIVEETVNLLKVNAINKGIEINIENGHEISAKIDKPIISAVLRNLITNAVKFTNPGGKIKVSVRLTSKSQKDDFLEFSIQDNGIGIDEKKLKTVFESKKSTTTYGTQNEKGSGIGLSLCKDFIEMHNGKIWAHSEPEKGSTFKFIIPVE